MYIKSTASLVMAQAINLRLHTGLDLRDIKLKNAGGARDIAGGRLEVGGLTRSHEPREMGSIPMRSNQVSFSFV